MSGPSVAPAVRAWRVMRGLAFVAMAMAAVALLSASAARGERYANGNVEIVELPRMVPTSRVDGGNVQIWQGYIELRYVVRNLSGGQTFVVELATEPALVRRSVRLAPQQEMKVSLLLPVQHLLYSEQVIVSVDGRRQGPPLSVHGRYRENDKRQRLVLLSQGNKGISASSVGWSTDKAAVSEMTCRQWSSNYLAYVCFNAVVITEREQSEMTADILLALRRYAEAGGEVVVIIDKPEANRVGRGINAILIDGARKDTPVIYRVGLGSVYSDERNNDSSLFPGFGVDPRSAVDTEYLFSSYDGDLVLGMTAIPAKGLLVMVVLFGLVVGPLNFFVLAKRRRRVWIWWTVPAISLVASGMIFGYAMLSEGVTGRSRCVALTVLDENVGRASTVGYLSYYCPLTPGPLDFSYDTEVTLLGFDPARYGYYRYDDDERAGVIDFTRSQRFIGWLPARTARGFQVRKNEDRRERLPVRRMADGNVAVVNGLGVTISKLSLTDADGKSYVGENLIEGQEQVLRPLSQEEAGRRKELPSTASLLGKWPGCLSDFLRLHVAPPGAYVALVERTPFVEVPVGGMREDGSYGLVYGISKREAE